MVLQQSCEAELHPTPLGHESQSAVGAGVVKPRTVEHIGDIECPLSPRGGLRKCDVRQKRTWSGVFVSGGENSRCQGKATQSQGQASRHAAFPTETGLGRGCERQTQPCSKVPLTEGRAGQRQGLSLCHVTHFSLQASTKRVVRPELVDLSRMGNGCELRTWSDRNEPMVKGRKRLRLPPPPRGTRTIVQRKPPFQRPFGAEMWVA